MEPFQTLYPGRLTKITREAGWQGQTKKPAWKRNLHLLIVQVAARKACSEAALIELISQTSDEIKKLIHRIASDLSAYEIDSITNRVFALVWFRGSSYSGKTEPGRDPDLTAGAWLEKIIRNECYSYLRELKRDKSRETQESDLTSSTEEEENQMDTSKLDYQANRNVPACFERLIEEHLIQEEQLQAFQGRLTKEQNHIVELKLAEVKGKEIAGELGISQPAVSQKISTIKRIYQQFVEDYDQE